MSDEFFTTNNAPLKFEIMTELKKTVALVVNLDLEVVKGYVSKQDMAQKLKLIEEKLQLRVTAAEFNEALTQYDETVKEDNKKTYDYIQSVKKYMSSAEKEFAQVKEDFKAYDTKLNAKAAIEELKLVWNNFGKYSLYEDLKDLYSKTVPEI